MVIPGFVLTGGNWPSWCSRLPRSTWRERRPGKCDCLFLPGPLCLCPRKESFFWSLRLLGWGDDFDWENRVSPGVEGREIQEDQSLESLAEMKGLSGRDLWEEWDIFRGNEGCETPESGFSCFKSLLGVRLHWLSCKWGRDSEERWRQVWTHVPIAQVPLPTGWRLTLLWVLMLLNFFLL